MSRRRTTAGPDPTRVVHESRPAHVRAARPLRDAGQALRDAEQKLRAVLEATSSAVLLRDAADRALLDCNAAALRVYRARDREALLATSPLALAADRQADGTPSQQAVLTWFAIALRDGSARFEWLARRLDGDVFPAVVRLTVIPLDERTLLHSEIDEASAPPRLAQPLRRAVLRAGFLAADPRSLPGDVTADMTRALERLQGDRALLLRIAAQFVGEAPRTRDRLRDAIIGRDRVATELVSTRLRGQAASFDAHALLSGLVPLENAATRGDWKLAASRLVVTESDLDGLLAVLAAELR
jgi:PAS domain-containing protein